MLPRITSSSLASSYRRFFLCCNQSRFITLQPVSAAKGAKHHESYEEKNLRLKRPLSPHLSIYKVQLTTTLSITHRITGIAVTGYVVAIAASSSYNVEGVITAINNLQLSPVTLLAAKTILALPVSYHVFNGIRHLIWDVGRGLSIKSVYTSGYITLAGTIILSLCLAQI